MPVTATTELSAIPLMGHVTALLDLQDSHVNGVAQKEDLAKIVSLNVSALRA